MKLKFFLFAAMCMFAFNASAQFTGTGYYYVKPASDQTIYLSVISASTGRTDGAFDALTVKNTADASCMLLIEGEVKEDGSVNVSDIKCNGISATKTIAGASNLGANPKFTIAKVGDSYEVIGTNDAATVKLALMPGNKVGTRGTDNKWIIEPCEVKPGDVTGDGTVDLGDLAILRKYMVGETVNINAANADVNGDGKFTIKDLNAIKRIILEQD